MEECYSPRHGLGVKPPVASPWDGFKAVEPTGAAESGARTIRPAWGGGGGRPGGGGAGAAAHEGGLRHKQVSMYADAHKQHAGELSRLQQVSHQWRSAADPSRAAREAAGPYQKDAAVRANTRALQPWSPYAGMGERAGALMADAGGAGLGPVWQAHVARAARLPEPAPYGQPAHELSPSQQEQLLLRQMMVPAAPYSQSPPPSMAVDGGDSPAVMPAASPYAQPGVQHGLHHGRSHNTPGTAAQYHTGSGEHGGGGGQGGFQAGVDAAAAEWFNRMAEMKAAQQAHAAGANAGDTPGQHAHAQDQQQWQHRKEQQQWQQWQGQQQGQHAEPHEPPPPQMPPPPTDLFQPSPATAEAYARAAGMVTRPGTGQVGAPDAWAPVPGAQPRQIWPQDMAIPPRYCVACRGEHAPSREKDINWEPFSPEQRLANLSMLTTRLGTAHKQGRLCVKQNADSQIKPVVWTWRDANGDVVTPATMSEEQFVEQIVIMFDGLREGHEPYRHLATQAALAFLATGSPHIVKAAPRLVQPLRYGMQTYEPHLFGHAVHMLRKLLLSHPKVAPALRPHFSHFLGYMGLFRLFKYDVQLPPPFCCIPAGSFTGRETTLTLKVRSCPVCHAPLNKDAVAASRAALEMAARAGNAHLLNLKEDPVATKRNPVKGRKSKKMGLPQLIDDTLEVMVRFGGEGSLSAIQKIIPRFTYFNGRKVVQ